MTYKAVFNGNSLCHFNPNHDPKNGRFTFTKYSTSSGGLSDIARKEFGIYNLNSTRVQGRSAKKQFKKEYKERIKAYRKGSNIVNDFFYELSEKEAEEKLKDDIKAASKNKSFVKDLKESVTKIFNALDRSNNNYWDVEGEEFERLKEKYPEFSDLIDGFSPGEKFDYSYEKKKYTGLDRYLKLSDEDAVSEMLNYDFYYEPRDFLRDAEMSTIFRQANYELTKHFVDKYGTDIVPKNWEDFVKENQ